VTASSPLATPEAATRREAPVAPRRAHMQRASWAACALVVLLAAVIRLWGLPGQPVLYFDSGVYLGEGAFLASAAQRAAAALAASGPPGPLERVAQATAQGTDAHPPDIAKPGHAVLLAASMLVLGKAAFAGTIISALAGIGTVAATYALGMLGWGPRVAIPASVFLAVSGQHLVYSREPLVEADGLFFATLAALIYLRARGARGLLLAGVVFGVSFTCNNRLGYLPAVLFIAELAHWAGWPQLFRRGLLIGIGFAVPIAAIQAAYLAARGIGGAAGVPTQFLDYAQQLAAFTRMNAPDRWRPDEWPTYFVDLALMDGLVVLALFVVGLVLVLVQLRHGTRLRRIDLLLLGSLLVPLALYSAYSTGEVRMRHFSLAIPWVMLAAALGLAEMARFAGRRQDLLIGAVGVVVCALAVPRIIALDSAPNGMPAVVAAVGSGPVAGTNGPVLAFYVGEDRSNARLREAFVNVPSDLSTLAQTYPTLVVDMQAYLFPGELTDRYERAPARLTVAHGNDAWYLADLLEHYGFSWGSWNDLLAAWAAQRGQASLMRVYDIRDLLQ
jgi:Dolichyl-phosphate-mannose-protein mannosyltransferase